MSPISCEVKAPPAHADYEGAIKVIAPEHELDGTTVFLYPDGHARVQFPKRIVVHGAFIGGPNEKSQIRVRTSN
jgi:hypothetical protein